jgi:hypothetical protein
MRFLQAALGYLTDFVAGSPAAWSIDIVRLRIAGPAYMPSVEM